jgi:polyphosphate kinase
VHPLATTTVAGMSKLPKKLYKRELERLQSELVKMQYWVRAEGARVVVLFEGRDAAGKGGAISRIAEYLNPRSCHTVALGKPTEAEATQWYFQRYVSHLPSAGEIVLFDRSWYNRAGVEKVMGFCTDDEYDSFMRACPTFERLLVDDGIIFAKYWFQVSQEEQGHRLQARIDDPTRRWKISDIDMASRSKWYEFSEARDAMFRHTDIPQARWWVVEGDDKRSARINCAAHLLSHIPYTDKTPPEITLPDVGENAGYEKAIEDGLAYVPDHAATLLD